MNEDIIKRLNQLYSDLDSKYTNFKNVHKDVQKYITPFLGNFDVNNKDEIDVSKDIINNTATLALRDFVNGLFAYVANGNNEWFKLIRNQDTETTNDIDEENLIQLQKDVRDVIASSNIYQNMIPMYYDIAAFGNGVMLILDTVNKAKGKHNQLTSHVFEQGTYRIDEDASGTVNTFAREFDMSVKQLMETFKEENLSEDVKQAIKNEKYNTQFTILHIITDGHFIESKHKIGTVMEYKIEKNAKETILDQNKYREFPVLCSRFIKKAGSVYSAYSPAITCLGDTRELQTIEDQLSKTGEKKLNPAKIAVDSLQGHIPEKLKTGQVYFVPETDAKDRVTNFEDVVYDEKIAIDKILRLEQNIRNAFMLDMFKALSMRNNTGRTAQEVKEIENEKLTMIGTILESLNRGFLEPLVERVIAILKHHNLSIFKNGNSDLAYEVQFVSIMHKAQREDAKNNYDNFVASLLAIANAIPEVLLMVDKYEIINQMLKLSEIVSSKILKDKQTYEGDLKKLEEEQARQVEADMANENSQTAKNLNGVDMTKISRDIQSTQNMMRRNPNNAA